MMTTTTSPKTITASTTRAAVSCPLFASVVALGLILGAVPAMASVALQDVADQFGLAYHEQGSGSSRVGHLTSRWTELDFRINDRFGCLNGVRIYLGRPVDVGSSGLAIDTHDLQGVLQPLLSPSQFTPVPRLYRIVIDPGHGGHDPGAVNATLGVNEKDTTLDVAKRLRGFLGEYGYRVFLTRDDDRFLTLDERAALANRVHADLFISLHFNAVEASSVEGVETYVMTLQGHASTNSTRLTASARRAHPGNANDPWNALAGYAMQRRMVEDLGARDRGLRRARFAVLRQVSCPAVLVEGGFVSHPQEGQRIGSAAYREQLARALLAGILDYQKRLNELRQ